MIYKFWGKMHLVTPVGYRIITYGNFVNLSGKENQLFYFRGISDAREEFLGHLVVLEVKLSKGTIPSSRIALEPALRT